MKRLLMLLIAVCVVFVLMPLTERAKTEKAEKPQKAETVQKQETTEKSEATTEKPEETKSKLPDRTARFATISTSLGGNIAMNFYVELSDDLRKNPEAYMQFLFADETLQIPLSHGISAKKDGTTVYVFSCPIAAKNITDEVTAQVCDEAGAVGESKTMSVAAYCKWIIENYNDPDTVALMEAILNYGASAQSLFGYRTENLANAVLAENDRVLPPADASAYAHRVSGTEAGIQPVSYTLVLDSVITVRIYFALTGSKTIDQYIFTVDGERVTPVFKDGRYYVEKQDIPAQYLEESYVFTCGGITIHYSGMSYVNQVMNKYQEGPLFDMASALYAYAKAAEAYIG